MPGARPSPGRALLAERNAVTTTPDGRDLAQAEWRRIPEFPKYQITPDGDIRNQRTGNLLTEVQNKTTGAWSYTLRKAMPNGVLKNFTRNYRTLLTSAYPEVR